VELVKFLLNLFNPVLEGFGLVLVLLSKAFEPEDELGQELFNLNIDFLDHFLNSLALHRFLHLFVCGCLILRLR
jgi:hypothetical protein